MSNEIYRNYSASIFLVALVYRGKQQYGGGGGGGGGPPKRDRPPPSPQPGKLLVRGYPEGTSDDELRSLFERFGKLEEGAFLDVFNVFKMAAQFSAHQTE